MGRSKSGIGVRVCPQIAPPWPKLTPAGLSGRQTGAVEREVQRAADLAAVRVFPGRNQVCVGSGCFNVDMLQYPDRNGTIQVWDSGALSPQIAPPRPKLTPAALSGRCAGAVEREDERLQREHQFGGVFPGRDQDCVRIERHDDQSMGFGCAEPSKSPSMAQTDACWLVWQMRWSC
jgi:hypothetical protein